jgi:dienelactone hydrolase
MHVLSTIWLVASLSLGDDCSIAECRQEIPSWAPGAGEDIIPVLVARPEADEPSPAVVIMHDCSGLGPRSSGAPARWSNLLVEHGYVTLRPDSFSTRGQPDGVCTNPGPLQQNVSPDRRAFDAYAALVYARTLPYVDPERVALMGGSHGGTTTLVSMAAADPPGSPLASFQTHGFAAAVALYPSCGRRLGSWRADGTGLYRPLAPLTILIGELDDWTPAPICQSMVDASQAADLPVSIHVYPGAHHSFDSPSPVRYVEARINRNSPTGRGATTGGNPEAWQASIAEVLALFERNLEKK